MGLLSALGGIAGNFIAPGLGGAIGGALGGALEGGASTAGGMQQSSAAQKAAQQAASGAQFRPVGITNTFGTSNFGYDPNTGQMTSAGYSLSPQLQGYQTQLGGMTGQGLQAGQGLMNLGQQYLGESPEAVRQRYVQQQSALLAPGQEQALAGIRNNLFQTGRGGLSTGATEAGGLAATNPEMAAYYNSLANSQRQIAAGADQAAQQQITFGQGLLSSAYDPFKAGLASQSAVESLGQQPFTLSSQLGTAAAQAGGNAGQFMTTPAYGYSPQGTALSALGNASAGVLGSLPNYISGFGGTPQGAYGQQDQYLAGAMANPQTEQARKLADENSWFNQ